VQQRDSSSTRHGKALDVTRDRSKRACRDRFADAVLAIAAEPTPANVVRYLAASRALEEEPRSRSNTAVRGTARRHQLAADYV
jgi:hypothetical protein